MRALATLAVLLCGCSVLEPPSHRGRPLVVVTTTQLGDIVRHVAGRAADVHQILQPNTDPHEYEPRPADVVATGGARLVVESGDDLDRWMAGIGRQAGGHPAELTVAPAHIRHRIPGDPHWWHDPRNVESAAQAVARALARVDPKHARAYLANARAYAAAVRGLDAGIARCMAAVPASQRTLVTSHDAFGYFARRYGIRVVGAVIPSQSTEGQPSAGALARLAALVRREHVKAVFPESSLNAKLARALARQTGARAGFALYGDTLGPAGSRGATYLGMEAANADAMIRGFTGGARGCRLGPRQ